MRMRSHAMWTWFPLGISYYPEMRNKMSTGKTGITGIEQRAEPAARA